MPPKVKQTVPVAQIISQTLVKSYLPHFSVAIQFFLNNNNG